MKSAEGRLERGGGKVWHGRESRCSLDVNVGGLELGVSSAA